MASLFPQSFTVHLIHLADFYKMKLTDEFRQKLAIWHVLSFVRMGSVLAAWLLASSEYTPMTLLLYWRFTSPHCLVQPPVSKDEQQCPEEWPQPSGSTRPLTMSGSPPMTSPRPRSSASP
mmetsp:Transcript_22836/g.54675  ORF Transcript_22836/g.54675 Transcript_22836/m.54675 type:complete len:120 (+) Transcript_22836:456-815(+)